MKTGTSTGDDTTTMTTTDIATATKATGMTTTDDTTTMTTTDMVEAMGTTNSKKRGDPLFFISGKLYEITMRRPGNEYVSPILTVGGLRKWYGKSFERQPWERLENEKFLRTHGKSRSRPVGRTLQRLDDHRLVTPLTPQVTHEGIRIG